MRKFGTDAPEFMEFTLGGGETVYKLPLAAGLPMDTVIELQEASEKGGAAALRYQMDLLRRYMGPDVEALTVGQVREIYSAWTEESARAGATPGE